MSKKRILMFGTYPIINPQHGGQHRVSALVNEYIKSGLDVKYVAVFQRNFYPDFGDDDIALDEIPNNNNLKNAYISDVNSGKRLYSDTKVKYKVIELIKQYRPDIIHIEQMFLYFGIQQLLKDIKWTGKLVYGSQNIEYELKRAILVETEIPTNEINQIVEEIREKELQLIQNADLVITCTDNDTDYSTKHGAKDVVIAQNGIYERNVDPDNELKWRNYFSKKNVTKPVLFIGSAHPPNISGFEKMVGYGLGFLPQNSCLILVGGVSDLVKQNLDKQPNYIKTAFEMRVDFLGRISEKDLATLLSIADTIILPITEGGGSNLKTAEAILADVKIVATPHALRSYEAYEELPNMYVAKINKDFRLAVQESVMIDKKSRTEPEQILASKVTWSNTLREATERILAL